MQSFTHISLKPGLRLWTISIYIFYTVNAGGSTYWVSKSCKDSGPGSSAQPWLTLARASETLTVVLTALQALIVFLRMYAVTAMRLGPSSPAMIS